MLTALPVTIKQNEQPHRMDRADGVLTKTNISISSILENNLLLCVVPWQRRDTQSKFLKKQKAVAINRVTLSILQFQLLLTWSPSQ